MKIMHMTNPIQIDFARPEDTALVLEFILEIAEYEHLTHEVMTNVEELRENLFGEKANAEVLLARIRGEAAGYAVIFHTFSTFLGRKGLWLEDIFVKPQWRTQGIGKALFMRCAEIARERQCGRMEWAVLNWNKPSIDFYRHLGAKPLEEWTTYRLDASALDRLFAANSQES
jgi:GNAT superfamily N-acetyltransferase